MYFLLTQIKYPQKKFVSFVSSKSPNVIFELLSSCLGKKRGMDKKFLPEIKVQYWFSFFSYTFYPCPLNPFLCVPLSSDVFLYIFHIILSPISSFPCLRSPLLFDESLSLPSIPLSPFATILNNSWLIHGRYRFLKPIEWSLVESLHP